MATLRRRHAVEAYRAELRLVEPAQWPHIALRRDAVLVLAIALALNVGLAALLTNPGYFDATYYFNAAQRLAAGQGLSDPYLWNYLALDQLRSTAPPYPGFAFWMPLTSLLQAGAIALARLAGWPNALRAAQAPSILFGSLLPVASYLLARETWPGERRRAWVAATLTLLTATFALFWSTTDSFGLYGLLGAACLYATARARRAEGSRWLIVAGLTAGLAHLTRADGVLLLVVALGFVALNTHRVGAVRRGVGRCALVLGAYLLVMAPWFVRDLVAFGTPLAPGDARVLLLTEYNDLFAYPASTLTLAHYLSIGLPAIAAAKLVALLLNARDFVFLEGNFVLTPALLLGLWALRRRAVFGPALVYTLLLWLTMSLAFTYPGPRGALLHSATALLPFAAVASAQGLDVITAWLTRSRPQRLSYAQVIVSVVAVLIALGLSAAVVRGRLPTWNHAPDVYAAAGAWLADQPPTDSVVTTDAADLYYASGRTGYATPNGGVDAVVAVAQRFGARWLLLDDAYPAGLRSLYNDPASDPRLQLRASFREADGQPGYLFEIEP